VEAAELAEWVSTVESCAALLRLEVVEPIIPEIHLYMVLEKCPVSMQVAEPIRSNQEAPVEQKQHL